MLRVMGRASDRIAKIASVLAAAICLFTIENLLVDPWLQRRSHHRLPSFVPAAPGGAWFLILAGLAASVIFLVVCQVLLMRDAHISKGKKWLTGILVLPALLLSGEWLAETGGARLMRRSRLESAADPQQKRSVVLRWQASTTPNVKYSIYRGPFRGIHPEKLNTAPIDGTTFTDTTVVSGKTYWYVVLAVNAKGELSFESNETSVTVP